MAGCYECGSDAGEAYKLCPECIAKKQASKAQQRVGFRNEQVALSQESDLISKLLGSGLLKGLAVLIIAAAFFVYYLTDGPLKDQSLKINLLLALVGTSYIVGLLSYYLLVMEMLIQDFMWGFMSLFLPIAMYIYVVTHPGKIRLLFILHVVFGILSVIFTGLIAKELDIHFLKVWIIFYSHLIGKPVSLYELQ